MRNWSRWARWWSAPDEKGNIPSPHGAHPELSIPSCICVWCSLPVTERFCCPSPVLGRLNTVFWFQPFFFEEPQKLCQSLHQNWPQDKRLLETRFWIQCPAIPNSLNYGHEVRSLWREGAQGCSRAGHSPWHLQGLGGEVRAPQEMGERCCAQSCHKPASFLHSPFPAQLCKVLLGLIWTQRKSLVTCYGN